MDEGQIHVTQFANPLGVIERREYKWVGGPVLRISNDLMQGGIDITRVGDVVTVGPYKLKIIEFDWVTDSAKCVRVDYPFWWLIVFWHHSNRLLDLAYRRFIITLAVWKLADYHAYSYPSWWDVHIVQRISKLVERLRNG